MSLGRWRGVIEGKWNASDSLSINDKWMKRRMLDAVAHHRRRLRSINGSGRNRQYSQDDAPRPFAGAEAAQRHYTKMNECSCELVVVGERQMGWSMPRSK